MQRPNLAGAPFLDTRPVVVATVALAVVAVALTALSVVELVSERGQEAVAAASVRELEAKRSALLVEVTSLDRELARTPWKRLKAETSSMHEIVVQHRLLWGALLADLERVLPWDTRLTVISPSIDSDGAISVSLSGIAASRSAWLRLLSRLLTDSHFAEPVPLNEEAPGERNAVGFRFSLRVKYWPEGRP
jgi:Tfp pilus assembly protein PilN